ncbi:hypothetical protein SO694_00009249 [Aureococcus anophagefferens]|uniref:Circumsporozoite protein n=1 Tax=Aureococcus anophagefferens TaxID=44056 RepID=A0ABR1GEG1_AURAN
MNSEAQKEWEDLDDENVGFKSVAGGDAPWFLRSTPYYEPNGNYDADCWLTAAYHDGWEDGVGFSIDDQSCGICSASYLCSSNLQGDPPTAAPTVTPAPTTPEPSVAPTISPAPTTAAPSRAPVCEEEGEFDYADGTVHCLAVNDKLYDLFPVNKGERTCGVDDVDDCPDGMSLWVPRDYEHAAAVYDAFGQQYTRIAGIYRDEDGCGGCRDHSLNSYDQALYEGEAPGNLGFTSILPGNGKWFLRQVFNGRGWNQPDGNYHARCWLNIYGFDEGAGLRFDDQGCVCQTRYLCSSNQITKGWSTYAPTSTPEDPTMTPSMLAPTMPPMGMKTREPTMSEEMFEPTMMPVAKTLEPTMVEMSEPTAGPTMAPVAKTADPTTKPTMPPTTKKTAKPTAKPTASPTEKPTSAPVTKPTAEPTEKPTSAPVTPAPSVAKTADPTTKPTMAKTAKPTAKPTAEPTEKPTSAPVTPAPSAAEPCEDSTSWIQGTKADRTCAWIGTNAAERCTKKSADKVPASVACRAACGSCGESDSFPSLPAPDCVDSKTWRGAKKKKANPKETCKWVAEKAEKRCKRKDVDKVKAKVACPVACGTCD